MDKNTLNHYGWVVIILIILAIMIGLASPFGNYIKSSFLNLTYGLGDRIEDLFDAAAGNDDETKEDIVDPSAITWFRGFDSSSENEDLDEIVMYIILTSQQESITREEAFIFMLTDGATTDKATAEAMFAEEGVTLDDVCAEIDMTYDEFINYLNNYEYDIAVIYSEVFIQICNMAEEMQISREQAFLYMLTGSETATKDDFAELVFAEYGVSIDEYMLSEIGVAYDDFVASLNGFDTSSTPANLPLWIETAQKIVFEKELPSDSVTVIDITKVNGNNEENKLVAYYTNDNTLHIAADGPIYAATNAEEMFSNLENVKEIDFNNSFNTSQVENMSCMFAYNDSLEKLNLSDFNTTKVKDMSRMFCSCSKLEELNISDFNTSNVTDMSYMFANCYALTYLNLNNFNTAKVTNVCQMFSSVGQIPVLNLKSFDLQNTENVYSMFSNSKIENIKFREFKAPKASDYSYMFNNCHNLKSVEFGECDTSGATNMSHMFYYNNSLVELDLSGFDTSNVTDMSYMFNTVAYGIGHSATANSNLKRIDLSSFDTSKVENMSYMFTNCAALENIDLSGFDTSNVTTMHSMFMNCRSLETIDLSNFDTSKTTEMSNVFYGCESLINLDITSFTFINHTNIKRAFAYMDNLKVLKLPNSFKSANPYEANANWGSHNCEIYYDGTTDEIIECVNTVVSGPMATHRAIILVDGQYVYCNDGSLIVPYYYYNAAEDKYFSISNSQY